MSLNYLNLNELVDDHVLRTKEQEARQWANEVGFNGASALTADINGFSWSYGDALYDAGITRLYTCIHTHHGMYPLFKKQTAFKWQTPEGHQLLVWSGDHYMIGNEFQLVPDNRYSYILHDRYSGDETTDQMTISEYRIPKYLQALEDQDYPFDFVPISLSGVRTDNSPANPRIMENINRWNGKHGDQIELKLSTLDEFFDVVEKEKDLPVYSGDWPDWWADGVSSTPGPTKLYKSAQRKYQLSLALDPKGTKGDPASFKHATQNLMMYAEHTWGYSASVSNPWNSMVNALDLRKAGYAIDAFSAISENLDQVLANLGEVSPKPYRTKTFKVLNPSPTTQTARATAFLMSWESVDGQPLSVDTMNHLRLVDVATHQELPTQVTRTSRGFEVSSVITLPANGSRHLQVIYASEANDGGGSTGLITGAEGVSDLIADESQNFDSPFEIKTDNFEIHIDPTRGISQLIDRQSHRSLLSGHEALFNGIYEKTPIKHENPGETRKQLGRNRKGIGVERDFGKLTNIELVSEGALYVDLQLDYSLVGTKLYRVTLRIYKHISRIECTVAVQKTTEWAPENLYVSLPLGLGEHSTLYLSKGGCLVRPRIDQLPGSNVDYLMTQEGVAWQDDQSRLMVGIEDAPLVTFGSLDAHLIKVMDFDQKLPNQTPLHSWVMNNFWETNFKADLSGFYEFRYVLQIGQSANPATITTDLRAINNGFISFRENSH